MGVTQRPLASAWPDWHPGERAMQARLGLAMHVTPAVFRDGLTTQHQLFYATRLSYLPVTTLDAEGRPWASLLTSKHGTHGFITNASTDSVTIQANIWDGDPIRRNLTTSSERLFAAVGVEASNGRRNKFGGQIVGVHEEKDALNFEIDVKYSLGLCPKYIAEREVVPHTGSCPTLLYDWPHIEADVRLPNEALAIIRKADTAYFATSFVPSAEDAATHPPRVSVNHRGGQPGFIRVRNDGRTLVLPNYAGNRMLNSLGNIHETPRAGFVFPDFDTGSVLYITGTAETLFDAAARALMPDSDVLTTVYVTGLALVVDALPLRHANAHFSAYSPPVRFLAEEIQDKVTAEPIVHLVNATVLTPTLTHYTFRAPHALSNFKPAGTVILDLRRTFGHRTGHDDCVRTWTVSHPPSAARPDEFGLTLRTAAGGVITPLLAAAVRDRGAEVTVADLGIFGALRGASSNVAVPTPGKHLWIAGGIGSTPFLALSRYISTQPGLWDITLFLSTGEPTVLPMLFAEALAGASDVRFALHIFTNEKFDPATLALPNFFMVRVHAGRIPTDGKLFADVDAPSRHVHICGPLPFVNNAMAGLENAGIDPEMVFRERFTY